MPKTREQDDFKKIAVRIIKEMIASGQVTLRISQSQLLAGSVTQDKLMQTIQVPFGGTGLTITAVGDLILGTALDTLSRLSDVVPGYPLLSGGTNANPAYAQKFLFSDTQGLADFNADLNVREKTATQGAALGFVTATQNFVVGATDCTISCAAGTFNVTLPTAAAITGTIYNFKKDGTGRTTVLPSGAQTIEGETYQYIYPGNCMTVQSTGSAWLII